MKLLAHLLLALHLGGFALVFTGLLLVIKEKLPKLHSFVVYGARFQLLTGVLLYGVVSKDVRLLPATVKVVITLIIVSLVEMYQKKSVSRRLVWLLLGLVIIQLLIAVLVLEK